MWCDLRRKVSFQFDEMRVTESGHGAIFASRGAAVETDHRQLLVKSHLETVRITMSTPLGTAGVFLVAVLCQLVFLSQAAVFTCGNYEYNVTKVHILQHSRSCGLIRT